MARSSAKTVIDNSGRVRVWPFSRNSPRGDGAVAVDFVEHALRVSEIGQPRDAAQLRADAEGHHQLRLPPETGAPSPTARVVRTAPLMNVTAMEPSSMASTSFSLKSSATGQKTMSTASSDVQDLLREIQHGFLAAAAGGAPVERDFGFHATSIRWPRSSRSAQRPQRFQLLHHFVDHHAHAVAFGGGDPLQPQALVFDAHLLQEPS